MKKNNKSSRSYEMIIISLAALIFIIVSFRGASYIGMLNENSTKYVRYENEYTIFVCTGFFLYTMQVLLNFRAVIFLKSINIFLLIINLYFGFFMCTLTRGTGVLWLMVINIKFLAAILLLGTIYGVYSDILYIKNKEPLTHKTD